MIECVTLSSILLDMCECLDKNHEMDLLTSHQVDATLDEEPSGDEEEEENQTDGKATEATSTKGSTTDTTIVPNKSENNKISSTPPLSTASVNKSSSASGTLY